MSRAPAAPAGISRPTGFDYLLVFVGLSFSLFLFGLSYPQPEARADTPEWVKTYLLPLLPQLMVLPQGVILLWPLFYATQRMLGRPQALSAGEWLWGVAWLGTLLLAVWLMWRHFGTVPEFLEDLQYPPQSIWTIIVAPTLAALAVVIGLTSLIARWRQTWTHTLGLVLVIWPVIPLAGLLLWAEPGWRWSN
jgi:hypothetical protein